jgi:branched-chain amino acid transport system substrate-binding protein
MLTRRLFMAGTTGFVVTAPYVARAQSAPIKIGWMQALTGPNSSAGVGFDRGVQFQVKEINAAGGVNGRKIDLTIRDTQGDPTKAVNIAQELISSEKVNVLIGPSNSGETLAVTPIVARAKVPQIHAGTIDELINPSKYPNAFRVCASLQQWVEATNNYMVGVRKLKKIAVIGDSTGYGSVSVDASKADLAKRGITVTYSGLVDLTTTNLLPDVLRAKESGAEGLIAWTPATSMLARVLDARGELKWDVPVMGHPTLGSGAVGALLAKQDNWKDVYQVDFKNVCYDSAGNLPPRTAELVKKLDAAKIRMDDTVLWYIAFGVDAVNLVADAAKAGATTSEQIIKHMNTLKNYPGYFGTYSFSETEHNGFPTSEVVAGVSNTVKPEGTHAIAAGY